jgi:hypothetical protein
LQPSKNSGYVEYSLKQGNQYAAFMGAYEIFSYVSEKPKTCVMDSKVKKTSSYLFNYCLENFHDNLYIAQFFIKYLGAMESTNILQKGDDENICPDEYEDEVKEKIKNIWSHLRFGMCGSLHYQNMIVILKLTENSIVMHVFVVPNNDVDASE